METLLSTFTENIGNQQDQNLLQDNNVVPEKTEEKITATQKLKQKIYWQMFLTEDFNNQIQKKIVLLLIFYRFWCKILIW